MRKFNGWICALLAAFFFLVLSSYSAFAQPGDPDFLSRVGSKEVPVAAIVLDQHTTSLWVYWMRKDLVVRHAQPWPEFWTDTCKLSGIPCVDAAWRKIQSGTAIIVPAGAEVFSPAHSLSPQALAKEVAELRSEIALLKDQLKDVVDEETTKLMFPLFGIIALLAFALLFVTGKYVVGADKSRRLLREREHTIEDTGSRLDATRATALEGSDGDCCRHTAHPETGCACDTTVEKNSPASRNPRPPLPEFD